MSDLSKLSAAELDKLIEQAIETMVAKDKAKGLEPGADFIGETVAGSQPPRTISVENLKADLKDHLKSLINDPNTRGFVKIEGKEVVLFNVQTDTAIILSTKDGASEAIRTNDPNWLEGQRSFLAEKLEAGTDQSLKNLNPYLSKANDSILVESGNAGLANIEAAHNARVRGAGPTVTELKINTTLPDWNPRLDVTATLWQPENDMSERIYAGQALG